MDEDLLKHPELAYTDEQVKEEEEKMSPQEQKVFQKLKEHHLLQYRTQGFMTSMTEVVQEVVHECYLGLPGSTSAIMSREKSQLYEEFKQRDQDGQITEGIDLFIVLEEIKQEADISSLSLYSGKTILDLIDLTMDDDKNLYIKVETNGTFHNVLTYDGGEEGDIFCDEEKVKEISIRSSDEEDVFVNQKAAKLLRKLAHNKRERASLMEEAAELLEEGMLP